ncbi:uncharacterized protein UBRO_02775 [Ustilago bromivora]|uniref:Peptidase S9 prolyl oligopeptidase catalytic domain-containing protein n=1 Tax=Ustilago bromivora TaxID=307758 RepID=A0A1K0HAU3_9BASI|nr:uncharacterized protein UBRO_02775 [Ustilago bromivora]SYW78065.1 uncharacterized protein UBRO2_02257 [Ustilago bromivora]
MLRNCFRLGSLIALLVTSTLSTQQIFSSEPLTEATEGNAQLSLNSTWQVLGPFPAGMRELPFGGFPPSVSSSYADLLDPNRAANRHFSTYGPTNATTILKSESAQVQLQDPNRVKQSLTVEYADVDWPSARKSAGWSSLQWQMIASTDLDIARDSTAVAISMDKTAEFAVIPKADFGSNATLRSGLNTEAIEWHTGDWYSYIAAFSKEDKAAPDVPISHHLLHLNKGSYKLLARSMYEIRIFGDPRNNGGAESPKMTIGIDVAACSPQNTVQEDLLEVHTDPQHSNVPHVVGGWIAGVGLTFAVRNLASKRTFTLESIEVTELTPQTASPRLVAELGHKLTVAPAQTVLVPVIINQSAALDSNTVLLRFTLRLSSSSESASEWISKSVRIPLIHKPAFWEATSSADDHNAYIYSYLAADSTVQLAAATPPKLAGRSATRTGPLPPLILTLHGAGVDLRDLFFSNSIRRQEDSWSILPTGRTPWGYDWQLASFQAADAAVTAFHEHLYGLPATMSEEERQRWQFDPEKLFIMGHSNGGQGAWYRLSRFPDRVIGGMVGSAYTKVSDYVSFGWKVGRHFVDPALQGLLHSGVTMFENDLYASNLAGLDLLVKYGSADANVPPWNSKDMAIVVDGWNRRSGLVGKVKIAEAPGKPHWWDTFFSEDDVQEAIESACLSRKNPDYKMPDVPRSFTLTVFNPAEAGSKGGWKISEVNVPGRLAKLKVHYEEQSSEDAERAYSAHVSVVSRNTKRIELDLNLLLRTNGIAGLLANATTIKVSLNGQFNEVDIGNINKIHFQQGYDGKWYALSDGELSATSTRPRPIGPLLRIVSSEGPVLLIVPTDGPKVEVAAWKRVAQRFANDLLLYGAINSQIITDADFVSKGVGEGLQRSNIVTLGGPQINSHTRSVIDSWPSKSPIHFPAPSSSAQFDIQGRSFYKNGTALLTLAPHPTYAKGLTLVVHGIGAQGISRAARLLPTRTATMTPEYIVTDHTAKWMGEGGVQAAGWYDSEWGWSESMSYVQ